MCRQGESSMAGLSHILLQAAPALISLKVNNLVTVVLMMQDGYECRQAASKPAHGNSTVKAAAPNGSSSTGTERFQVQLLLWHVVTS